MSTLYPDTNINLTVDNYLIFEFEYCLVYLDNVDIGRDGVNYSHPIRIGKFHNFKYTIFRWRLINTDSKLSKKCYHRV